MARQVSCTMVNALPGQPGLGMEGWVVGSMLESDLVGKCHLVKTWRCERASMGSVGEVEAALKLQTRKRRRTWIQRFHPLNRRASLKKVISQPVHCAVRRGFSLCTETLICICKVK